MKFSVYLKKKGLLYLPLVVLAVGVVVRIATIYLVDVSYLYDEIIVTRISRLEISQLFETIQFEPHPPGFYILLKALPVFSAQYTKIVITLVSFLITLYTLGYAYKKRLLEKYKISTGIALFLASYTFFDLSTTVKQDSISFPLLLLLVFVLVNVASRKDKRKKKELLFAHLLTVVLLLLGYIYYFQALLLLFFLTVYLRKIRLAKYMFLAQLVVLSIYMLLYGFDQAINNLSRFAWISENTLSFVDTLSGNIMGISNHFVSDVHLITFIGLIVFAAIKLTKGRQRELFMPVAGLAAVLTGFGYIGFFVRGRYVVFLMFLLSILAGWGLTEIRTRKGLASLIYLVVFIPVFATFPASIVAGARVNRTFREQIIKFSRDKNTGFLTEHPIFSFVFNLDNNIENLVPVNVFFPRMFDGRVGIDKQVVQLDGYYQTLKIDEIKDLLSKNELEEYVYWLTFQENRKYYDPDRHVLKALQQSCATEGISTITYGSILFKFSNCKFD